MEQRGCAGWYSVRETPMNSDEPSYTAKTEARLSGHDASRPHLVQQPGPRRFPTLPESLELDDNGGGQAV